VLKRKKTGQPIEPEDPDNPSRIEVWLLNARVYGIVESDGLVNVYFHRALNRLWEAIHAVLINPDYEVTCTGHSLGGALASLACLRIVAELLRPSSQVHLYTYGQPRTGDRHHAYLHDELVPISYRIVNKYDVVPHIPPTGMNGLEREFRVGAGGVNYHHGAEVWFLRGFSLVEPRVKLPRGYSSQRATRKLPCKVIWKA